MNGFQPSDSPQPKARAALKINLLLVLLVAVAGWFVVRTLRKPLELAAYPTVARSNLVLRANCWFWPNSSNRFTGWIVETYPDGGNRSRVAVSNGLLEGTCENWFTNGAVQSREFFTHGVSNGRRGTWFQNGRMHTQANVVNGKMEGIFQRWYENGQLAERIPMLHGKPDGTALAFFSSGFAKAETQVRAGRIVAQESWPDGKHRE